MTRRAITVATAGAVFLVGLLAGAALSPGDDASGTGTTATSVAEPADRAAAQKVGRASADPALSATEAAVEYATASQQWLYLTDGQIDEAVRSIAVPSVADRLSEETVADLSVARDALAHAAGPVWWFVRPLAVHAEHLGEDRAEVSVWVVTVLSAADVAVPQADWVTIDVDLVRDGDRWLLESIADTVGPTPMSGVRDDPWQPEPFAEALFGFERIGAEQ